MNCEVCPASQDQLHCWPPSSARSFFSEQHWTALRMSGQARTSNSYKTLIQHIYLHILFHLISHIYIHLIATVLVPGFVLEVSPVKLSELSKSFSSTGTGWCWSWRDFFAVSLLVLGVFYSWGTEISEIISQRQSDCQLFLITEIAESSGEMSAKTDVVRVVVRVVSTVSSSDIVVTISLKLQSHFFQVPLLY